MIEFGSERSKSLKSDEYFRIESERIVHTKQQQRSVKEQLKTMQADADWRRSRRCDGVKRRKKRIRDRCRAEVRTLTCKTKLGGHNQRDEEADEHDRE
jgi:hypothetical protein